MNAQPKPGTRFYPDAERYPLEREVVVLVEAYLSSQNWPFERMPCRVAFDLKAGSPCRSKNTVSARNGHGQPVGRVEMWFNLSYLHQNPGLFLNDLVAHECAHVLAMAEAAKKNLKISEHGEEWKGWLARLSAVAMPKGYGWRGAFDDNVCLFAAGGVPYTCGCNGDDRYHFIPLRNGPPAGTCGSCHHTLKILPRDQVPLGIVRQTDALLSRVTDKNLYGWLD